MNFEPKDSAPELLVSDAILIGSIDRAGDHAAVLGMLVVLAVVGALVYGLYLLVKSRADRPRSDHGRDDLRGPET